MQKKSFDNFEIDLMIRRAVYLTCIMLSFIGCGSSGERNSVRHMEVAYHIDIESTINHKSDMELSVIAENVNYISLETTENSLVRNILKVHYTKDFIYVSDENGLYLFDSFGKFIRQIGSRGRGPGEYSSIMNFEVSEVANIVIVQGQSSTIQYDLEGNYVRSLGRLPGQKFKILNQEIVFYRPNSIERPVNLVVTSLDFELVREFYNNNPKPETNVAFTSPPLYLSGNRICFKEHFNDTLFYLTDSLLVPYITFNEKGLLLDQKFELKSTGDISDLIDRLYLVEDKLMIHNILEGERYVFVSYIQGMNPRTQRSVRFLFDKEESNTYCINNGKFINDIDGGIDFYPELIADSKVLIQWIEVLNLKEHIASDSFKNSEPTYPIRKKALEELANSLSEDDNPVLMVVTMK
jgi:hypothetical protein